MNQESRLPEDQAGVKALVDEVEKYLSGLSVDNEDKADDNAWWKEFTDEQLEKMMVAGMQIVKNELLALAPERPLNDDEIKQLEMIFNVRMPTREFSEYLLQRGKDSLAS